MTSLRNVKFSGLMLIMALVLVPLLYWPSSAAASITKPTVATNSASSIGNNTAKLNGEITTNGGTNITEYGFYYGATSLYTSEQIIVGTSINASNSFYYELTNLQDGKNYYFRAYAKNSEGTVYGSMTNFTTNVNLANPKVTTDSATSIGAYNATLNGKITAEGDSNITSYGFYYGTNNSPSTKVEVGSTIDKNVGFSYKLSALDAGTRYYFEAYATNDKGTSYGSILNFNANTNATFTIGSINYQVDGVQKITEVAPYIKDCRTLLPIIDVAYGLGMTDANVVWDEFNKTVTLTEGTKVVKMTLGSNIISVNNTDLLMDIAPEVSNGHKCLPLRWVAEFFGETVNWNSFNNTVTFQ